MKREGVGRLADEIRPAKVFSSWGGKVLELIHDDKLFI